MPQSEDHPVNKDNIPQRGMEISGDPVLERLRTVAANMQALNDMATVGGYENAPLSQHSALTEQTSTASTTSDLTAKNLQVNLHPDQHRLPVIQVDAPLYKINRVGIQLPENLSNLTQRRIVEVGAHGYEAQTLDSNQAEALQTARSFEVVREDGSEMGYRIIAIDDSGTRREVFTIYPGEPNAIGVKGRMNSAIRLILSEEGEREIGIELFLFRYGLPEIANWDEIRRVAIYERTGDLEEVTSTYFDRGEMSVGHSIGAIDLYGEFTSTRIQRTITGNVTATDYASSYAQRDIRDVKLYPPVSNGYVFNGDWTFYASDGGAIYIYEGKLNPATGAIGYKKRF